MKITDLYESKPSKTKWAIGSNVIYGSTPYKNRIKNGTFDDASIVWIHIEDAFKHTVEGFELDINDPTGGKNAKPERITKAKSFFTNGFMEPSELGVTSKESLLFGDGRHRLVAAYQLGEIYAPVIVLNTEIPLVKKMIRTLDKKISFEYMKNLLLDKDT